MILWLRTLQFAWASFEAVVVGVRRLRSGIVYTVLTHRVGDPSHLLYREPCLLLSASYQHWLSTTARPSVRAAAYRRPIRTFRFFPYRMFSLFLSIIDECLLGLERKQIMHQCEETNLVKQLNDVRETIVYLYKIGIIQVDITRTSRRFSSGTSSKLFRVGQTCENVCIFFYLSIRKTRIQ